MISLATSSRGNYRVKSLVPRNYSSGNAVRPIAVRDDDCRSRSLYVRFRCKPPPQPRFFMRIHHGLAELHVGASRFVSTNVRGPVVVSSETFRDVSRTTSTGLPTAVGSLCTCCSEYSDEVFAFVTHFANRSRQWRVLPRNALNAPERLQSRCSTGR